MDKQQLLQALKQQGIHQPEILKAMGEVAREYFIDKSYKSQAYENIPLPLDLGQTISQPFIVAYMTEKIMPLQNKKVLEIGTGSGYQAAILATLGAQVYSVERFKTLALQAQQHLHLSNIKNVLIHVGNGYEGWAQYSPYDAIIVTASAQGEVPHQLLEQLAIGGKMIIPIHDMQTHEEYLFLIKKHQVDDYTYQQLIGVRFVPFVNQEDTGPS
jgi:protein-L-isoaspartate(D-aspartate) O-methyltransferase